MNEKIGINRNKFANAEKTMNEKISYLEFPCRDLTVKEIPQLPTGKTDYPAAQRIAENDFLSE